MKNNLSVNNFEEAKKFIPGGVNSPVRAFKSVGGTPIFIKKITVPATYNKLLNTNEKDLLPNFNVKEDKEVIKKISNFFKNKKIIPVDCSRLIWGFGAIHCMTQQQPKF